MSEDRSTSEEAAHSSIERLTFFSDAVVAIAMTLLALELPVTDARSAHEFLEFLLESIPEFIAFLVSFFVIANYWRGHHRVFRYLTDAPRQLITTNSLWLLAIIVTPYATRLIYGADSLTTGDFPLRFTFYALVQAFAAAAFMLSNRVIERHHLLDEDAPPDLLARSQARGVVIMATFLVSIPIAFLANAWAFVVWGLFPVWMRVAAMVVERRAPVVAGPPD